MFSRTLGRGGGSNLLSAVSLFLFPPPRPPFLGLPGESFVGFPLGLGVNLENMTGLEKIGLPQEAQR